MVLERDFRDDLAGRESLRETWHFRFEAQEILAAARHRYQHLGTEFPHDWQTSRLLEAWVFVLERRVKTQPDFEYALTIDDVRFFGLAGYRAE